MKRATLLKLLFFSILVLSGIIIYMSLINTYRPDRFYCGGSVSTGNVSAYNDTIHIQPIHTAGEQLFKENCKSCHKIHEESVGPALAGVSKRRSKKWLYSFIRNSYKMIKKGDKDAVGVYLKYNKCEMTAFPAFTDTDIDAILAYIEYASSPQAKTSRTTDFSANNH